MYFRHFLGSAALVALTAAFAGGAAAQFAPPPSSYPPGGYRGAPDQDGLMRADPDDDMDDPEPRAPGPRRYEPGPIERGAAAPYPYDPRAQQQAYEPRNPYDQRPYEQRPYDQRPYDQPPSDQSGPRTIGPAPGANPSPNYDANYGAAPGSAPQQPYGHSIDRPQGGYAARPDVPGVQSSARPVPPADVAPRQNQPFLPFPNIFAPQQQQAQPPQSQRPNTVAALPEEDQPDVNPKELPPQFKRQTVPYATKEPAGSIVIDTNSTYLYYVLGGGNAIRYGIGVGREGFTWAGAEKISRMAEWPDWHPPAEMIERQPYLPRFMAGGESNPLGARALYLGKTIYRIHGTNQPSTIGKFVSSGCIRMLNEDVEDLFTRVKVGTRVVVLPGGAPASASSAVPITR
jgi:lipoprotein-anchoring transpeptidase ErfK/SrfK